MTRLYAIVRQELTGGALLAHLGHACREAPGPTPTEDERIVVLSATKAQMESALASLDAAGIGYKRCVEVDGPLAGSTPSVGFAILEADRASLPPQIQELKPWRAPSVNRNV
jgi:hypothetical protein